MSISLQHAASAGEVLTCHGGNRPQWIPSRTSARTATGVLLSTGLAASSATTFLCVSPGHIMFAPGSGVQMTGRRIVRTRSEAEKAARSAVRSTPEPATWGHDRRLTGEDVFDGARVDADGRHHFRVLRQGGFSTHMKTSVSNQNSTFHKVLLSHETKWSVAKQICPNHQPGAEYAAQDSRDHREYYRILGSPQP